MKDEFTIVATGDVHLSNSLPHAAHPDMNGRTDRLRDQVNLLNLMQEDAQKLAAPVILAGDVFDKHMLDGVTLDAAMEVLFTLRRARTVIGPGNHEASSPRGGSFVSRFLARFADRAPLGGIEWLGSEMGRKRFLKEVAPPWLRMWWVDYCPPDEARIRVEDVARQRDTLTHGTPSATNVLWLHHSVKGCYDGEWKTTDGLDADTLVEGWSHVISGHFHDPQLFGGGRGTYMGAPMLHDFGDAGEERNPRGWWRIRFKPGGLVYFEQVVPPGLPKFHKVRVSLDDSPEWPDPGELLPRAGVEDYCRIEVDVLRSKWTEQEAGARRFADACKERLGLRFCDVQPVFRHPVAARARLGEGAEVADARSLMEGYVNAVGVEDFDKEHLLEVGRAIWEDSDG